jgi:hypothetical protein
MKYSCSKDQIINKRYSPRPANPPLDGILCTRSSEGQFCDIDWQAPSNDLDIVTVSSPTQAPEVVNLLLALPLLIPIS